MLHLRRLPIDLVERSRHRAPTAEGVPSAGAGLGLAIARGIVEAHHGRIWAEAPPLGGASAHLTLPVS